MGAEPQLLSVVTPAFNEAENLPALYQRLAATLDGAGLGWEWIVVDDHSSDGTFTVADELGAADGRVRAVRFARNHGSHAAIRCGLEEARGDCAAVMAADLQDPPEVLVQLLDRWRDGARLVWAVRRRRQGERRLKLGFSSLYYLIMRRFVGLRAMPPSGADFFLADRRVIDALAGFGESNLTIFALLSWMGFPQASVVYDKQPRAHGRSGWSLEKKLKLLIDSVTAFTYAPIRLITGCGFVCALLGFLYAAVTVARAWSGRSWPAGWASLMVVVLLMGGMQMLMMGILGEYLWRALDESRRRPRYLVEARTAGTTPTPPRA